MCYNGLPLCSSFTAGIASLASLFYLREIALSSPCIASMNAYYQLSCGQKKTRFFCFFFPSFYCSIGPVDKVKVDCLSSAQPSWQKGEIVLKKKMRVSTQEEEEAQAFSSCTALEVVHCSFIYRLRCFRAEA
jgi:hypothetical protein